MSARSIPRRSGDGITGRHVLFMMIAFFGVIFAVNGVFLYKALSTHTGVVANEPYRKGLKYNERIGEEAAQNARGWQPKLALARDRLVLMVVTASGAPVEGLSIAATVGRPSTARHDQSVTLRPTQPGQYEAALAPLADGAWVVNVEAREIAHAEAIAYRLRRREWLKP